MALESEPRSFQMASRVLGPLAVLAAVAASALFLAPPAERREAIIANPPTVPEAVAKTLAGTASVAVGTWAVYAGAFRQELFRACASETLACTFRNTRWDAAGLTLLGLGTVSLGGWLVWKQVYVSRILASTQSG